MVHIASFNQALFIVFVPLIAVVQLASNILS